MQHALKQVRQAGYRVVNVDSTLILSEPKLGPHAQRIRANVAKLLGIAAADVGVKAKTPEGMGTDNAAIAHVVVLLDKASSDRREGRTAAEAAPEEVDEVVRKMLEEAEPPKTKRSK